MIKIAEQHYICEPVYTLAGRLVAMEVLTRFTSADGARLSYDEVSDILTPEYRWLNFVRQLHIVRQCQHWLMHHQICVSLNIDAETAEWLLRDKSVQVVLRAMPFIRLEIHEHFPSSDADRHGLLHHLRARVPLWLDDVGSGSRNNFGLLLKGYFCAAKIDRAFFWQHHAEDPVRLGKVIRDLTRYAGQVVVEGVENYGHILSLTACPQCWLQGYHFRSVRTEHLREIPLWVTSTIMSPVSD